MVLLEVTPTHDDGETPPSSVQAETNTWRSCSGCLIDKRVLLFAAQATVSVATSGFCMYQLATQPGCESQGLYSGILSLILGTWLPQPKVGGK